MPNVQLQRGYLRIANRLFEALLAAGFTVAQLRILLTIIRLTDGWNTKTVSVSQAELSHLTGLSVAGGFRRALRSLIDEGVLLCDRGIGRERSAYMIQQDFTRWGKFAIAPARLAALWSKRPESPAVFLADQDSPPKDSQTVPTGTEPKEDIDPLGPVRANQEEHADRPLRDTLGGRKCDTELRFGDSKDSERQRKTVTTKSDATRPTWISPYLSAWKECYGGDLPVGNALKHLKGAHDSLGADEALVRWRNYLRQNDAQFANPSRFAATLDRWKSGVKRPVKGLSPVAEDKKYLRGRVLLEIARNYDLMSYNGNVTEYQARVEKACLDQRAGPSIREELQAVRFYRGIGEQPTQHFVVLEIVRRLEAAGLQAVLA